EKICADSHSFVMKCIVGDGSDSWICQITHHSHVRRQKPGPVVPPGKRQGRVEPDCQSQHQGFFNSDEFVHTLYLHDTVSLRPPLENHQAPYMCVGIPRIA